MSRTRDRVLNDLQIAEKESFQQKQAAWTAKKTTEGIFTALRKEIDDARSELNQKVDDELSALSKRKGRLTAGKYKSRDKSRRLYALGNKAAAAQQALKTQAIRKQLDEIDVEINNITTDRTEAIDNIIESRIEEINTASKQMAIARDNFSDAYNMHEKAVAAVETRRHQLTVISEEAYEERTREHRIFGNYKFGYRAWLREQKN